MQIHQSAEDYLECILKLSKELPVVRSIDIANEMNYSKPSISVAMKNLRLNGYINVDNSGFITLTESGMEIASNIYDRHLILRKWLEFLELIRRSQSRMRARSSTHSAKRLIPH